MIGTRLGHPFARLLLLLAFPMRAAARTAGADSSGTAPAPPSRGRSVAIILAVALLTLLAMSVAVKLFDHKIAYPRETETLLSSAQAS